MNEAQQQPCETVAGRAWTWVLLRHTPALEQATLNLVSDRGDVSLLTANAEEVHWSWDNGKPGWRRTTQYGEYARYTLEDVKRSIVTAIAYYVPQRCKK